MVLKMHVEMCACQAGFGMLSMVRCFAWFDPGQQIFILRAYAYDGTNNFNILCISMIYLHALSDFAVKKFPVMIHLPLQLLAE